MSFSTNSVNHRACRGNELPEEQQDQNRKYSVVQLNQLLPASQLPPRHSSAAPLISQAPQNEVPLTNRVGSKRIPPAVPARNRKRSNTDEESTTHKSTAINTAPHSTIAQYPNRIQSNPFLSDPKKQTQETQAHKTNTNPFEEKETSKSKVNLPTPPAIPPPPVRSRRASTSFQTFDGYLDPRNSALVQRRSSSPFQNNTNNTGKDLSPNYAPSPCLSSSAQLKPVEDPTAKNADEDKKPGKDKSSPTPKPAVTFSNVQQLEKQVSPNESGQKIPQLKTTHIFVNDKPEDRKTLSSQKPLLNRSTTESCETRIESEKTRVSRQENKVSVRQDSNVSSDSMSQTSSPSYNTKTMETPLLLHHIRKMGNKQNICDMIKAAEQNTANNAALTKSLSTPASLQTCVKFTESNMTLQHRIIRDVRRPSTNYLTRGRLKFRMIQVIVNAFALLALAGGLAVYFRSIPTPVRYVNKTITTTIAVIPPETNPAPGFCLAIVVPFCSNHRIPYNYTTFPNHVVNMNQQQAEQELELYDALVDVRCYELAALFLCSVIVPKCGNQGEILYPCRSLCEEMKRRCGFFLPVFGLPAFPEYLVTCTLLPDSENPNVCVGHREVKEAKIQAHRPRCSSAGFLCDYSRCIPLDWKCDGHLDCEDESDETGCHICPEGMVHCGENRCMNKSHLCDGIVHCPYGQDERNCLRLQDKMGDTARGMLQIFDSKIDKWIPACVSSWDSRNSPQAICSLMGYKVVNSTRLSIKDTNIDVPAPQTANWTEYKKSRNWMRDFRSCGTHHYPIVSLECSHYDCGKRRTQSLPSKRIVGGSQSQPGDWPFLAAILGGPEEIFYCAGVLISEQWVLSASHCVGNQTDIDGWKIQLGLTRRHSHNYYGLKTKVKRVIRHPYYRVGGNHDHDVALFQLKHPVNFNEHLLPVCLPPPGRELVPGTNCIVIGWGKSMDLDISEYEPTINEVEVPIIEREVCNDWLIYRDYNVTDGMICAGFAEGGKDACQGDSGGPLLCPLDHRRDRWFVGGIVSWGIKCAHPQLPGVYAYVPKYLSWIKHEIQKYID